MALLRSFLPFDEKKANSVLHLLALLAFGGSIYMGTHQRGPLISLPFVLLDVHLLSVLLWIGLGLAAVVFFRETVEDVWFPNGVWLVGCYVLAGLGTVMLTVGRDQHFLWWVAGLLLVGLGVLLLIQLWLSFYTDRAQLIRANPEVDPATFTLGYWNMLLPSFVLLTMGTYYFWSLWYLVKVPPILHSLDPMNLYMLLDLAVFGMAIYMLYIPQQNLGRYYIREVEPVDGGGLLRPGSGVSGKLSRQLATCQSCEAETRLEQRKCPSCQRASIFGWCPRCEHYSVVCPECAEPTVGGKSCHHCEADLSAYTCPNCGNPNPLRKWASS